MDQSAYWHKQTPQQPLYPDMVWSRPENKLYAGKLLVIGGNLYGFSAPAEAYAEAVKAGIGTARVLLPDALAKTLGKVFEAGEYAPSTPSGSFGTRALGEFLPMAHWADGVLIADDLGRNSETAILLEKFAQKYSGQLTVAGEAAHYFIQTADSILTRPDTLLMITMPQLQKLVTAVRSPLAVTSDMDLLRLIDVLHTFTTNYPVSLMVEHLGTVCVATGGQVSSTRFTDNAGKQPPGTIAMAAHAATWWLQNPGKTLEALTVSLVAD